jgi:hypothetical protein
MSDAPISAPEEEPGETLLIEAARAFESGDERGAAALWRERAIPAVQKAWPPPLAEPVCAGLELVSLLVTGAPAEDAGRYAVDAWGSVAAWLSETELPLGGGRSTPAHFRKHKRDPEVYRAVGVAEHLRLAGAGRAVALNNHALALLALGLGEEALTWLREAASLRREAFGWREAGLGTILGNIAAIEGAEAALPGEPVPVGVDRFLALAQGEAGLRRRLLAAAQLVPILRRPAG